MEFVFTPWKGRLIEDLRNAQREVILVCPYITKVIADEIFEAVANRGVEVRTVSRCQVPDDWLLHNRRPLLLGREVLKAVMAAFTPGSQTS